MTMPALLAAERISASLASIASTSSGESSLARSGVSCKGSLFENLSCFKGVPHRVQNSCVSGLSFEQTVHLIVMFNFLNSFHKADHRQQATQRGQPRRS